jgi:hypothetical protein
MHDPSDRDLERLFELDDAPGPARPVDDARFAAIIAGALGGAGFPPPGGAGGAGGGGAQPIAVVGAAKGTAVTKLALLAGGAITAIVAVAWLALRAPQEAPTPGDVVTAPGRIAESAPAGIAESAPAGIAEPAPARIAEREPALPAAAMTVDPLAGSDAEANASATDDVLRAPSRRPAKAGTPTRKHHVTRAVPAARATPETAAPEDLLAQANAARAAHRWREADALYARVARGRNAALAAQTALVASASLHLEHLGDPAGAARRFRAALAAGPRDTLAEDARWGLVEAARALGDAAGERRALDDFLAHHAGSALAPRARARRVELGGAR